MNTREHEDGTVEVTEMTDREIQIMRFLVNGRCNVIDARGITLEVR